MTFFAEPISRSGAYNGGKEAVPITASETRIPCSKRTRDRYVKPLKRGGETYDALLRRMARQYEPEDQNE